MDQEVISSKKPESALPEGGDSTSIAAMRRTVTIDDTGRLVVPLEVRKRFHLHAGSRLSLVVDNDCILLTPERAQAIVEERSGILVVQDECAVDELDHRRHREERLGKLSAGPERL
jgi:AbrB family looped-hinge helix DNA binding protein